MEGLIVNKKKKKKTSPANGQRCVHIKQEMILRQIVKIGKGLMKNFFMLQNSYSDF